MRHLDAQVHPLYVARIFSCLSAFMHVCLHSLQSVVVASHTGLSVLQAGHLLCYLRCTVCNIPGHRLPSMGLPRVRVSLATLYCSIPSPHSGLGQITFLAEAALMPTHSSHQCCSVPLAAVETPVTGPYFQWMRSTCRQIAHTPSLHRAMVTTASPLIAAVQYLPVVAALPLARLQCR